MEIDVDRDLAIARPVAGNNRAGKQGPGQRLVVAAERPDGRRLVAELVRDDGQSVVDILKAPDERSRKSSHALGRVGAKSLPDECGQLQ